MTTSTFTRGGLRFTVDGAKARPVWNESDHPRDRLGRFIETGAEVRMWGGQGGTVVRNVGGGRIEIERSDGSHVIVHRNYLTVTQRPDGSAPTSQRSDDIAALEETEASAEAVEAPEPTQSPDVDTVTPGQGIDDLLGGTDPALAERVRSAASDYQEALYNNVPDDEADERAALLDALDEVDALHGDNADIREQSQLLRQAASAEPSASSPTARGSDRPAPRPRDEDDVEPPTGAAPEQPISFVPDGAVEAPDATPDGALSYFTDDTGAQAWLSMEDNEPVGYFRAPGGTATRFEDSETWAQYVDSRGMTADEAPAQSPTVAEQPTILNPNRLPPMGGDRRAQMQEFDEDRLRSIERDPNFREQDRQAARDELDRRAAGTPTTQPEQPETEPEASEQVTILGTRTQYDEEEVFVEPFRATDEITGAEVEVNRFTRDGAHNYAFGHRIRRDGQPGGRQQLVMVRPPAHVRAELDRLAGERAAREAPASEGPQAEPEQAEAPEAPEATGAADLDDARERLRAYARERLAEGGYTARRRATRAEGIAGQDESYLRLSPAGQVLAFREGTEGRWKPYGVGSAVGLYTADHPGFDDDQIDGVLARLDATGIPFADLEALRTRWADSDQKRADMQAARDIVDDPAVQPVPNDAEMSRAFRNAVVGVTPSRRNARRPAELPTLIRLRDTYLRGLREGDLDRDEISRILRDENIGTSPLAERMHAMWRRYTGDTSEPESREDRAARIARESRDRAGFDDRFTVTGEGLFTSTLTRLQPGDVIYTRGAGTEASPVELPRRPRGGVLARTDRIPRTVDRIEGRGNNRTIHFTDGTSTGAEGGDRTGTTYSGRAAVFGVPADRRPEPGTPTPVKRPALTMAEGGTSAEVSRTMLDAFNFTAPNGWKTRLRTTINRRQSTVRGDILNEEGRPVGTVQRSVFRNSAGQMEVHHDLLAINRAYQGGGFADAYYKHLYEQYEAHGIDVVTINANIDVGGYAWAQRGFEWAGGSVPAHMPGLMQANVDRALRAQQFTPEQRQRIDEFREQLRTNSDLTPKQIANSLSDITWTETTSGGKEITMWPGKKALLGTSWNGTYRVGTPVEGRQRPEQPQQPAQPPEPPEQPGPGVITPGDWMNARAGRGTAQRADWYTIAYDDPDAEYTPSPPTGVFEVRSVQPSPGTDGFLVMLVGADGGRREIEVPADAQLTPADPPGDDAAVPTGLTDMDDQALQNELDRLYDIRGQIAGDDPSVGRLQRGIDAIEAEQTRRDMAAPEPPTVPPGRFATPDEVRRHLSDPDLPTRNTPEARALVISDPMLAVSDNGRWMVHRNPTGDSETWRIATTGSGVRMPGEFATREQALSVANALESVLDDNGQPFPADEPQVNVAAWRSADGRSMQDVWMQAYEARPDATRNPDDWTDNWWQRITAPEPEAPPLPDDLTDLTDAQLEELEAGAHELDDQDGLTRIYEEQARREAEAEEQRNARRVDDTSLAILSGDADAATVSANVEDMFSYEHPDSGWRTAFGVTVSDSRSRIFGSIVDRDGNVVGSVERTVYVNGNGEVEVHHDYLTINADQQGGGFADAYYRHLYGQYEKYGVDVVTINANIDVGGYAWAQRGFEWDGGRSSDYQRSQMAGNVDNILAGLSNGHATVDGLRTAFTDEQRRRIQEFRAELRTNPDLTPKQVANALSDITWTEYTRRGKPITMWPGKRALLGTSWNGTYRVGADIGERPEVARPQPTTPPEQPPAPPPIDVPSTPLAQMTDADLAIEAESNAANIGYWFNQRGVNDPSVEPLVRRQRDVAAARQQRIAAAIATTMPDGEDVEWRDLRPGDQVMVPFVTQDGPQVVEVVAVDANYSTVQVRLDDGTIRRHVLIGTQGAAHWRRGRVTPPVEQVSGSDLAAGQRVLLDDGRTGTVVRRTYDSSSDRVEVEIDVDGGVEVYDTDASAVWNRLNTRPDGTEPPPPLPDPRDMTDEELRAEALALADRLGAAVSVGEMDGAASDRLAALALERRRRDDQAEAAARATPITPDAVDAPTARPRLYTYQRRNLVALGLDLPDADADLVVKQAAARVRNRMPLTAEQSQALADHLHQMADDESLGVRKQRSTTRLALAMDASTAVALGRAGAAKQPANDRVRRVKTTGLTAGDTAVIRGRDGSLQTVRVLDAKPMMRGTLARLTLEHENGLVETRIVDRDTDAWLMPDLPEDKPVAPEPRTVREVVFAADIRPGDRIAYERHDARGEYAEGVVESVRERFGDTWIAVDGYEFEVTPTQLRTRLDRGAESADQPYWLTLTDEANEATLTGGQVRIGDLIADDGLTNMRGTVVDIEEIEGEGGIRGWQFQVADTDRGYLNTFTMFDPQVVTRRANAGENATHSVQALAAEHAIRQRLGGALAGLRTMQVDQITKTTGTILDRLGRPISGVDATRAGVLDAIGRHREAILRDINNGSAGLGYDARHFVAISLSGGYSRSYERRDEAAQVVSATANDAFDRLAESVRTAQPLPDEDESAMVRRVLTQWRDDPPTRHNERVARSLLAANFDIDDDQQAVEVPALPEGDLVARMGVYRQMIGGQFGHTSVRRATFADLDFDALERGETPQVTFVEQHKRDMDAADNGPGATAMRHLDTVKAAGADLDAAIGEREARIARARLRSSAQEFYVDGDTVETLRARMRARAEELSTARETAFERFKAVENDYLAGHGFDSLNDLNRRRMELRLAVRRDHLAADEAELERLNDLWQVVQDREHPALATALDEFYAARRAHQEMEDRINGLAAVANTVRRQAAAEVLAEVRELGGERLSYQAADATRGRGRYRTPGQGRALGERDQNVRAMRSAEDVLPRDWLVRIRNMVRSQHNRESIGLGSLSRGHADYRGNIRLSESGGPRFDGDNGRGRVAVHELGHFAERSVPGLLANEAAFLWSRTSTGEVGSRQREQMVNMRGRGGDSSQYGFLDEFLQPYSGVDYQRSRGRTTEAYELLTTGLESLFAGSEYMDEDYRRWLLGTLALL